MERHPNKAQPKATLARLRPLMQPPLPSMRETNFVPPAIRQVRNKSGTIIRIPDEPHLHLQNHWPLTMRSAGKAMLSANRTNFVPFASGQMRDKSASIKRIQDEPCPQNNLHLTRGAGKAVLSTNGTNFVPAATGQVWHKSGGIVQIQDEPCPQNHSHLRRGARKAVLLMNENNFVPAATGQAWHKPAAIVQIRDKPCPQNHWPLTMRGARKAVLPPTTSPRTRKKAAIMPAMGACSGLAVPRGAYIMARLLR